MIYSAEGSTAHGLAIKDAHLCPHCRNVYEHAIERGGRKYCPMCKKEIKR